NMKIGNGGVCFIQEDRCIIRVAVKIIQFAKSISCGKCSPCHYGFDLCEYYINRMLLGYSSFDDYSNLKETAEMIKIGASCLYIRSIAGCILSVMEMFKNEFIYLIENKITLYSFVKS
ncbi:NADH-ubiquinone oxidoreductase-F iron-sulfur binding region domain-containing protein, partial [Brachyspira hampsonii]